MYKIIPRNTPIKDMAPELMFNQGVCDYFKIHSCCEIDIGDIDIDQIALENVQDIIEYDGMDSHSKLVLISLVNSHGYNFWRNSIFVKKANGSSVYASVDTDLELYSFLLPKRINDILKREGLIKVSDLLSKCKEDLLEIPGFGRSSLKEIELFVSLFRREIITREDKKNSLLDKLQKLQAERLELEKKEQEINGKIHEVLQEISKVDKKAQQKVK